MIANFHLYRKALAALMAGVLPLVASIAPGIGEYIDPVIANVLSIGFATVAVTLTANKIEGANVIELARVVVDALDQIGEPASPELLPAPGVAQTVIGRADGSLVVVSASPVDADLIGPVNALTLNNGGAT